MASIYSDSLVESFPFPHCNLVCALVKLERRGGRRPASGVVSIDITQNKMVLEGHLSDNSIIRGSFHWLRAGKGITQETPGARDNQNESPGLTLCWQGCLLYKKVKTLYHIWVIRQ